MCGKQKAATQKQEVRSEMLSAMATSKNGLIPSHPSEKKE